MNIDNEVDEVLDTDENAETGTKAPNGTDTSADTFRILEALLFASDELLNVSRIKSILPGNPDGKQIRKMVDKINVQLQKERHPFEIVEIGGGYQFRTVAYYHPWVRQIFKEKVAKKLSLQALECLAIVAYKQPISKAEIEAVRGVVSDGAMKTLLEKKLITISGRSDKPGRPLQYSTTSEFIRYFGLNKIEDLPRIEEFEAIAREKIDDLSLEELRNGESDSENQDESSDEETSESTEKDTMETQEQSDETKVPQSEPTAVIEEVNTDNDNGQDEKEKDTDPSAKSGDSSHDLSEFEPAPYLSEINQIVDNGAENSVTSDKSKVLQGNQSESGMENIPENTSDAGCADDETEELSGSKRDHLIQSDLSEGDETFEVQQPNETAEYDTSNTDQSENDNGTVRDDVFELNVPDNKVNEEESDESKPPKKGFFSKIRKKKNEELDE
ncbi:MAG: SMC-Scp complex subunit ScpB [Fibrobacter sp.]|nr:SMC-Scp complex subunit ScpB [Fibrobacter sp.]